MIYSLTPPCSQKAKMLCVCVCVFVHDEGCFQNNFSLASSIHRQDGYPIYELQLASNDSQSRVYMKMEFRMFLVSNIFTKPQTY